MKKKGFTLIELLAVILILGIIALIAVPITNSIIKQARMGAFKTSVGNIVDQIEKECQVNQLKDDNIVTSYTFSDSGITPSIDIKGSLPNNGSITVDNNCNVSTVDVSNGTYSAVKKLSDETFTISNKVSTTTNTFMNNLDFYYVGDSIMEGLFNDYKGVSYYMNSLYGVNNQKDYSVSGSFLTNFEIESTWNITKQIGTFIARINNKYSKNTVLVFDAGGNDIINYETTKVTFDGSSANDMQTSFGNIIGSINAIQETKGYEAPIVYIMPKFNYTTDAIEAWRWTYSQLYLNYKNEGHTNLIYIDCNDFMDASDIQSDNIHIKESGYKKIATKIYEELSEYYNK